MFGREIFERVQEAHKTINPDMTKKKEAEDIILKEGKGICEYCGEEIFKNEGFPAGAPLSWESEILLGFCDKAPSRKHKPLVKWTAEGGVENV